MLQELNNSLGKGRNDDIGDCPTKRVHRKCISQLILYADIVIDDAILPHKFFIVDGFYVLSCVVQCTTGALSLQTDSVWQLAIFTKTIRFRRQMVIAPRSSKRQSINRPIVAISGLMWTRFNGLLVLETIVTANTLQQLLLVSTRFTLRSNKLISPSVDASTVCSS